MERVYLWGDWSPQRVIVVAFLTTIAIGTLLLKLPAAAAGDPLGWVEALFTSTSATCVTGLIVVDTGSDLSLFGQGVVLALIQIGGLGIMTFSTLGLVLMGKRLRLRDRAVVRTAVFPEGGADLRAVIRSIVLMTLGFEIVGAAVLATRWPGESLAARIGGGLFHSISAFCNAGFGLFTDSLDRFRGDPIVWGTIVILLIVGGLGFPVVLELVDQLRPREHRRRPVMSLHSKVVLSVSGVLLVGGTVAIYLLEMRHTLAGLPPAEAAGAAFFQAATPRTAGFDTLPIHALQAPTLFLLILLMFVGGSPGSTAGGIKTTALGTLAAFVWARARGREAVDLFRRTLSPDDLRRAVTLTAGAMTVLVVATLLLLFLEGAVPPDQIEQIARAGPGRGAPQAALFLEILFETTSALGTVGLSTGLTSSLGVPARLLVITLMFVGRVGPLTLAVAIGQRRSRAAFRYPEEQILIG